MNKTIISITLSILVFVACSSTPLSMKPTVAKIPELKFYYLKNNNWVMVRGHGGDYFSAGEPKQFKIVSSSKGGECIINYQDGDIQKNINCTDSNETLLDFGNYYATNPNVIGISVAMKDLGAQFGYFYVNMRPHRPTLPVDFTCPYQATNSNMSVCTRPATYTFSMSVHIDNPGLGKLQYVYQCDGKEIQTQSLDVAGPSIRTVTLNSDIANYCAVSLNYRSVDDSGNLGNVAAQHIIDVRFYDPQYIPLAVPVVTTVDGGYKVCAGEKYDQVQINGNAADGLDVGDCTTVKGTLLDFLAWDSIGRTTWSYNSVSSVTSSAVQTHNGFSFYTPTGDWLDRQVEACHGDFKCMNLKRDSSLRDPKLIQAVEAWDAALLTQ